MTTRVSPLPALRLSLQQPDGRHRAVLQRAKVARWIRAALLDGSAAEITVRVVGADEGRRLNLEFRDQNHATNVLTFDYARTPVVVADLLLCAPVVESEAAAQRIGLEAHYAHLVVHGTLHAQGFDHQCAADARVMERQETAVLGGLGIVDPYRHK